jgi:hypothetical protein
MDFSPENEDSAKKQTQFKPNFVPNKANSKPKLAQKSGGQTQSKPIMLLSSYSSSTDTYPSVDSLYSRVWSKRAAEQYMLQ